MLISSYLFDYAKEQQMSQAKTLNEQEIKQVLDYVSTKKYAKYDVAFCYYLR